MKTLIIGVGAFGFAILNHISKKNKGDTIYAYEKNDLVSSYLKNFRKHPYFFEGAKLGKNIVFIDNIEEILPSIDLLILSLPCQFVLPFFNDIKKQIKPGVTILNLAKGINNKTLNTVGDDLKNVLTGISYNYTSLSGGMIAADVVKGNIIGATIGAESEALGNVLKNYFETPIFKVNLCIGSVKNIELAGALKNIFAIFTGYQEGLGLGASSLGYFFCEYYTEYKKLFKLLGGDDRIKFDTFAIGGDLIATCFGNSRNRYFGRLVGEGHKVKEVLETIRNEKKIAEGYETLKGVYKIIQDKDDFTITKELGKKILFPN
ncbi:MAG: NAD(P)H-dependent glycerol-3-phosphate dehydrogenase [Candidatus Gracilibacteria bacterium]